MENNEEMDFFNSFPKVKKVSSRTLADDIDGLTTEETAIALSKMFEKFKDTTGYEVNIKGDSLPTRVFKKK